MSNDTEYGDHFTLLALARDYNSKETFTKMYTPF